MRRESGRTTAEHERCCRLHMGTHFDIVHIAHFDATFDITHIEAVHFDARV